MHLMVLGMTGQGKSNTLKILIDRYRKNGGKSILIDPLCDPEFNADFQTDKQDEFLKMVFSSRRCLVLADESGESVGRYNDTMNVLATRGRHWGHTCVFSCQKATQLAPLVRDQCEGLFLFKSGLRSIDLLKDDFACKEIDRALKFEKGEYLYMTRNMDPVYGNIFDDMKAVGLYKPNF